MGQHDENLKQGEGKMTVGELKIQLNKLPDSAPVLISGNDHSYVQVGMFATTARYNRNSNYYCEDHGDAAGRPNEVVIDALVQAG